MKHMSFIKQIISEAAYNTNDLQLTQVNQILIPAVFSYFYLYSELDELTMLPPTV